MKKRIICCLLILCLLCSMLPTTAFAAEEELLKDFRVAGVNPMYEDIITESNLIQSRQPLLNADNTLNDPYYYDAYSAAELIRDDMLARDTTIIVNAYCESSDATYQQDAEALVYDILAYAMKHTGSGGEGDYILWHTQGFEANILDAALEEGYLFQRMFKVPTNIDGLAYEVAAYYVIGDEKIYTAKQTFYIKELLYEHILSSPKAFDVQEVSPIIDVQKWNKYEMSAENAALIEPEEGVKLSQNYFIGMSTPDANGNVKMHLCYAIPSDDNTTVGIRYNFIESEIEGEPDAIRAKTQIRRERTNTLYKTVISEKETLTAKDFGLDDAYLVVITLSSDLNTVLRENYDLTIVTYYSTNALEYQVINTTHNFIELVNECVVTYRSISVNTYTFQPLDYSKWVDFSTASGNATGNGLFKIRVSKEKNDRFAMQIASAVPSRFLEKLVFVFSMYDKNGNPIYELDENENRIPVENEEIELSTLYPSIFGNTEAITSKDFGIERGYIFTMLLNNIEIEDSTAKIKIDAYYRTDYNEKTLTALPEDTYNTVPLASLTFTLNDLVNLVETVK